MSIKEVPPGPSCHTPLVAEPLTELEAGALAHVFKALADPVRLRLVSIMASYEGGEACVCDLTEPFDLTQPTISHHLKVLREAGLVTSERRATSVYYRVVPEALASLAGLLTVPAGRQAADPVNPVNAAMKVVSA
ncbi:metalloregulator ArsR/SmtB family transcription factor [Catenulispora subtropica]|uniref:ArsR/SmtB family transcription factor n=1 Tax=Catenulispora subtropica TaxID=450798 RepID=UPI0031D7FFB0